VTLELRAAAAARAHAEARAFFDDEARKNHQQGWNRVPRPLEQMLS